MRCKWDGYPKIQTVYPDSIPTIPHCHHCWYCWLLNPIEPHLNPLKSNEKYEHLLSPQILTGLQLTPRLLASRCPEWRAGGPQVVASTLPLHRYQPHNFIPKMFGSLNNMGETSSTSSSTYLFILFYLYWEPLYTQNRLQIVHYTTKSGTKKYTIGLVCIYIPSEYT